MTYFRSLRGLGVGTCLMLSVLVGVSNVQADTAASVNTGLTAAASRGGLEDFCRGQSFRECAVDVLGNVISVALELSGIVLLGYILYAGFLWMTSGGETEKAKEARIMILNAVVGLIILVSAFAISQFVFSSLQKISDPVTTRLVNTTEPDPPLVP